MNAFFSKLLYFNKIPTYNNKPILTIDKICEMIKIKVPKRYENIKNMLFIKTKLINNLENKNEIINNIIYKKNYNKQCYYELSKYFKNFKKKYRSQECFEHKNSQLIKMLIQWYYLYDNYGFNYNDYFDYEMYNKKIDELDDFLNNQYRSIVYKACNNKEFTHYFKNKVEFNTKFSSNVYRKWIDSSTCSKDEFEKFVLKYPKFFTKPITGTGGYGAKVKYYNNNLDELFNECKNNNLICEEIVKQNKNMAKFNKDTLNTLRLYTLLPVDGHAIVTLANARFGRNGNDVDNFHSGGVSAGIDLDTGIINTDAINRAHIKCDKHPDTNIRFKGFKIPCWQECKKQVCMAAESIKEVRHIGWDIAITEDNKIEFIEGNAFANFDITQAVDQIGKKYRYDKYIKELQKKSTEK